jgi:hypothetical protein
VSTLGYVVAIDCSPLVILVDRAHARVCNISTDGCSQVCFKCSSLGLDGSLACQELDGTHRTDGAKETFY